MKGEKLLLVALVSFGSVSLGAKELGRKVINIDFNSVISKAYTEAHKAESNVKGTIGRQGASEEGFDLIKVKSPQKMPTAVKEVQLSSGDENKDKDEEMLEADSSIGETVRLKVKVKKHDIDGTFDQALDHEISSIDLSSSMSEEN